VDLIDFTNSYMTFFMPNGGNVARILLDAACTLVDERDGDRETFYLIQPCRAERMYLDGPLFQLPNYEFCGIFSATEFILIRTHWLSERDNREAGAHPDRFEQIQLDIQRVGGDRLDDSGEIVAATLANRSLVARTALVDEQSGLRAILEYPIKTMNVQREPVRFQVDTGPLILPDFGATAPRRIERFEMAHVVYHRADQAEFILRRPRPVIGGGPAVTDYTEVLFSPAANSIFSIGQGER
jgi:hypothetical protein